MKKCIRCQAVIGKKLRPGGARRPPPPHPTPRCGPLHLAPRFTAPSPVVAHAPARGSPPSLGPPQALPLTGTPSRRRHGGGQRRPRPRPTAAAGGGAAEPLPADGGAHHLPHLHRQPHPPRVPVRSRRLRALRRCAQRLPHLPPAHPRPHPDLRVARVPCFVPGPRPATALASPSSVFYKKINGLCAWLPAWGGAVGPPPRTIPTWPPSAVGPALARGPAWPLPTCVSCSSSQDSRVQSPARIPVSGPERMGPGLAVSSKNTGWTETPAAPPPCAWGGLWRRQTGQSRTRSRGGLCGPG